jgi:hypothetical protein
MQLRITFNLDQAVAHLDDHQRRQVPFALAVTLNRVVESRQRDIHKHIDARLTIRSAKVRKAFRNVVLFRGKDRADKRARRFSAVLRILGGNLKAEAPLEQRISSIVLRQEEKRGSTSDRMYVLHKGRKLRHSLFPGGHAIPAPGLRTPAKNPSRAVYPASLGLLPQRAIAGGEQLNSSYKGGRTKRGRAEKGRRFKRNTRFYFTVNDGRRSGVYVREQLSSTRRKQRVTPTGGRWTQVTQESQYDAVWFFRRSVKASRRIDIDGTFRGGIDGELRSQFDIELREALATARPRAPRPGEFRVDIRAGGATVTRV